ncbi:SemiSWEET family sugar transporter [Mongoliimonas terrestris]|uniref:SemiSWEET family sugar transporter n=1 Tax=Mongoliimonas terrestris TaxID=1709001 RepID=UPI000949B063|nr:SemiSWEET transporter [Mongoliimonas terrestris]
MDGAFSTWLVEAIGALAAILGTICWLPQAIRTVRTRDTRGLSLASNLLLLTTVTLWFLYGVAIGAWPLVAANIVSMVLIGAIVAMKLRHG